MLKIFSISLNSFDEKNISFSVECSKGTYVRVLGKIFRKARNCRIFK